MGPHADAAAVCIRHPRLPRCVSNRTAIPAPPFHAASLGHAVSVDPGPSFSLLLSSPVAAYVPAWYLRSAVQNWLHFTLAATTRIVLHMDGARATNFTEPEWRWLRDDGLTSPRQRPRVLLNPLRLRTWRRSGSLLAAHVHNYLYARSALPDAPPTHVLFLASNCFFIRSFFR